MESVDLEMGTVLKIDGKDLRVEHRKDERRRDMVNGR